MEVADGALADFGKIKADLKHLRNALLPVNVAFAHVLLGQPLPAQSIDPAQIAVSMALNGRVIGERKLDPPIDLWANVLWIVNHFILEQGYTIARGQVIIPGNLTGIHVGEAGRYEADFGALGSVELEVQ
jgi:2-keto-4-pentenoate hydratase